MADDIKSGEQVLRQNHPELFERQVAPSVTTQGVGDTYKELQKQTRPEGLSDTFTAALTGFLPLVLSAAFGKGPEDTASGAQMGVKALQTLGESDQRILAQNDKMRQEAIGIEKSKQANAQRAIIAQNAQNGKVTNPVLIQDAKNANAENDPYLGLRQRSADQRDRQLDLLSSTEGRKETQFTKKEEQKTRDEYEKLPITKQTGIIKDNLNTLETASNDPVGDVTRIFALGKLQHPEAAVRQANFTHLAKTRGLKDAANHFFGLKLSGDVLTTEQRQRFLVQGRKIAEGHYAEQGKVNEFYKGVSDSNGFNDKNILNPVGAVPQSFTSEQIAAEKARRAALKAK